MAKVPPNTLRDTEVCKSIEILCKHIAIVCREWLLHVSSALLVLVFSFLYMVVK